MSADILGEDANYEVSEKNLAFCSAGTILLAGNLPFSTYYL